MAASSVELGIIGFGDQVEVLQPLTSVAEFDSRPALVAEGLTQRKQDYQQAGVS
ncbi:hypothetical protein [Aeromonas sobria]|uniref:hypothetical protein n=1 Tax=Aeromonas sobria TaxID=646 RepID=UPI0026F17ABF|nr:hypothetical protein [Aeromonas sobria]